MAVIKRGVLGGFAGKVANVVGTSWKGIAVMKSLPLSVANPRTGDQVAQRTKFKTISQFASFILAAMIIPLMNRFAVRMSGYNMFVAINTENVNAVGDIGYSSINFGTGKLGSTPIASAVADASADTVAITWNPSLDNAYKQSSDEAYVMVVNTTTLETIYQSVLDVFRDEASKTIAGITDMNVGNVLAVYLIFKRADGTQVGNTAYISTNVVA